MLLIWKEIDLFGSNEGGGGSDKRVCDGDDCSMVYGRAGREVSKFDVDIVDWE